MKAIHSLFLAAALTAAGLAGVTDVQAARGASSGGGHSSGGHWSGGGHGGGHWSGGHWSGGHWGGGHWGGRYWGPVFYVGAPLFYGSYWGYPYSYSGYYPYDYYYPRAVAVDRYPQSYPEGVMESAPTTQVPPQTQGAPSQGPTYMNFCASANAYYPKVTSCPEGWKFLPSR